MKRLGGIWPRLVSFENLLLAYRKARRGKGRSPDVARFALNLETELLRLQRELQTDTYRPGAYRLFRIYERKPRVIAAAPFRDRVVHHALMNLIEPSLDRTFIHDSYACRRGKGVHAAVDRYQAWAKCNVYALKMDVSQYFPSIDHAILLAYSDALDPEDADARTLITLLHLRDIADRTGFSFSIVTEMMDSRNTDLAQAARADDFIVSDRVVSLILSHVAEATSLRAVLASLFDPAGSEIYLRDADHYVALDAPHNFYTVVEAARRRGEVAMGYRVDEHAGDPKRRFGVVLNPDKSALVTFRPGDKVIVLAEK